MSILSPELQAAIEKSDKLDYLDPSIIPVLRKYREESIPYYLEILKRATVENALDLLDKGLWNAIFLMAENHIEEAFPHLLRAFHLDEEDTDYFGDMITEDLQNVFYHTYNGDLDSLCELVQSPNVDYYVRSSAMYTIQQLYLDGIVSRERLITFLRNEGNRLIEAEEDATYVSDIIAMLHLFELEDMLREITDKELYEYIMLGNPLLVLYDKAHKIINVCKDHIALENGLGYSHSVRTPAKVKEECRQAQMTHLEKYLPDGVSFRPEERYSFSMPEIPGYIQKLQAEKEKRNQARMRNNPFEQMFNTYNDRNSAPGAMHYSKPIIRSERDIGRNDPCPCGSGKKYKKCCLLKQEGEN